MNLADFHFIRPYWLLSLLPYAVLVTLTINRRLSRGNWSAVCDEALLPYLLQDKAVSRSRWPLATGAIAALFAIFALAGPAWERLPSPVFRNDSALVIVLDLSRSMDAADITPSRLSRARFKISDILRQRKDGQTALIAYAGDAFTVSPLTNDTDTIENQLPALTTDIMPVDGNNIAKALAKAESLFKQAGLQNGQILLMTDGGNSDDAISEAKSLGDYQLLVFGIGTAEGAPIGLTGGFLNDDQGKLTMNKMDIAQLTELAHAGNGIFQPVTSDDTDIRNILSAIDLQSRESGEKNENLLLDQWSDKGPWLLLLALPLAAFSFRKGLLCFLLVFLLPIPHQGFAADMSEVWRDLWQTKDQQAQEAYDKGQYDKAAELFENPDWKAAAQYKSDQPVNGEIKEPKSAIGYYNQGNVYAKSKDYKKAIAAYAKALNKSPDEKLKEDIEFNKKLVEKALQEQQKEKNQPDKQQQDQQNKDKNQQSKNGDQQQQNKDESKPNPSEQNNDQPQKEEQQDSQQKPESKSEQSQQSTENQPDKKEEKADKQKEDAQAKPETQNDQKNNDNKDMKAQSAQPADSMSKEEQQAHEQWLKRIPDDPAGLLRRKFQYQYEQRERH